MSLTRRHSLAVLAAITAGPALAQPRPKPLVIAHRGASGLRPEHTLMGYRLAIEQGADVIEPDLVATKDGMLVARHETEITGTTDVSAHPEFAARAKDGKWFAQDFTYAEYQTLRAKERIPATRPENAHYDGQEPPPSLQAVIDLARAEARRLGRPIGIYPELKQWAELKTLGFDTGKLLLDQLAANGLPSEMNPVFLQSFEPDALKAVAGKTSAKIIQTTSDRALLTPEGLKAVADYAVGIGPDKSLVTPQLVETAHGLGLIVHPYTFRAENSFLPEAYRRGTDPNAHGDITGEIRSYLAMGIDGFFTDFPAIGVAARG